MSLLEAIVDQATSSETPLVDVLRRCKILAYRLKYEPLETWVDQELNGYADDADLPPYRMMETSAFGRFTGVAMGGFVQQDYEFGRENLPPRLEEHADYLFSHHARQGIAAIEEVFRSGEAVLRVPWSPAAARLMSNRVIEGFQCESAWRAIPRSHIAEVLDTVRNRILSFALSIQQASPDAGDVAPGAPPALGAAEVERIASVTIYGGNNVLAVGREANVSNVRIRSGDWSGLSAELTKLGFQDDDIAALHRIASEGAHAADGRLSTDAENWVRRASQRLKAGASAMTPAVAASLASNLILQYLGAA